MKMGVITIQDRTGRVKKGNQSVERKCTTAEVPCMSEDGGNEVVRQQKTSDRL